MSEPRTHQDCALCQGGVYQDGVLALWWSQRGRPMTDGETPRLAVSGLAVAERGKDAGAMKTPRLPRPRCGRIEPDADNRGYYCRRCGYDLIETTTGWFRHGQEFRGDAVLRGAG